MQVSLLSIALLAGNAHAFWRMSCALINTGRIDPIVNPGAISAHAHTIVGASNIGINSTYQSLVNSQCTSCEITADKSAYWTPNLYYQHPNGSFESVPHNGAVAYYLGRGATQSNNTIISPYPKGLKIVSGNKANRRYNATGNTWGNATYPSRPLQDAISFACLAAGPGPETPNMVNVSTCINGLRAQIHFQSCWDGVNLYKTDNSHVAYLSGIDNGVCPPGYPILIPHLFLETGYQIAQVSDTSSGGQFVFSMGDPTGYGFHGDFFNGWDATVQKQAVEQCLSEGGDGSIQACPPLNAVDVNEMASNCPARQSPILEQVDGLLDKLPGCVKITPGPDSATPADMECPAGVPKPSVVTTVDSTPVPTMNPAIGASFGNPGNKYLGCGNDSYQSPLRTLNAANTYLANMTIEYCQTYCNNQGYRFSGVEYGTQCYCDLAVNPSAQFKAGLNLTFGCTMTCPGKPGEICGGPNHIMVFNNTDPNFKPTNNTANSVIQLLTPLKTFPSNYVGCATEGKTGRALNGTSTSSNSMSVEACASACSAYQYYGLEYASQCFCGNGLASGSVILDTKKNAITSSCTKRCAGDFSEVCGGNNLLSVYKNTAYKPIVLPNTAGIYTSRGCVNEGSGGKALQGTNTATDTMTVEYCAAFCKSKSYKFMGIEYGRECYCDNSVQTKTGAALTVCPQGPQLMTCAGDKYSYCGKGGVLQLYST
ncbi:WSC-domain-containing protein [Myriangium duriaei CBS 260.36]|uniref:WSC-domain-containing protein n=1 Tax=Myriangium duriaei CBS 260.36 TaxID=1168546 RepID=A0A9P4JDK3_9PEZI|nr:WSC-domain-containing protein [Myriangium duriaei CBS 260.36]